jgi:hypothetical protein
MPTTKKTTARKSTKTSTASKSTKVSKPNNSASETVKSLAEAHNVNYRKARRIARAEGLGVGKGAKYDQLTKPQVKKLSKALAAASK